MTTKEIVIPSTMSTQHPDNASLPVWANSTVIEGEAELEEAFVAYSEFGCNEVMWDSEGKDVDTNVVRKLLSNYPDFFRKSIIGENIFLTYRIPNPRIEVAERKIVTETLQSIPLSADVCSVFYERQAVPVFEVILPFSTSGKELIWLYEYYRRAIAGVENLKLDGSIAVKNWVGRFTPRKVRVIPLVEDEDSLLNIDRIALEYVKAVKPDYLRVFIARSDPALNYGLVAATMLAKIALSKLAVVEESTGVKIHPLIGVGTMPFRGHLSPDNVEKFLEEYQGLSTVTTQSAMRYDYPPSKVKKAISLLNSHLPNGMAARIDQHDETALRGILGKLIPVYQRRIEGLAGLINGIAAYVPPRRARKLHIGLFGYSRRVKGVVMPRAIPFAAAFYSLGIPPEFIGAEALRNLTDTEFELIRSNYLNMHSDLAFAGTYVSWESINMLMDLTEKVAKRAGMMKDQLESSLAGLMADLASVEEFFSLHLAPRNHTDKRHANFINNFLISYIDGDEEEARKAFLEAATLRQCIG